MNVFTPLGFCSLVLFGALFAPFAAFAADENEQVVKRAELEDVQQRIRELEAAIAQTRKSRSDASVGLEETERAVSEARRRMRSLAAQSKESERLLAEHEAEQKRVEARIAERRDELAMLLRRHYLHGGSDVAPFLSGGDPNQVARDAHYLEHLGRARLELIAGLRADLSEQQRLVSEVAARRDRVVKLQAEHKLEQAALEKVLAQRAIAVAELSGQLHGQERAVSALRENEEHLARIVELVARQAEAARQRAASKASATPSRPAARVDTGPLAAATPSGTPFHQLRGKMGFPVSGELAGRFGAQRAEGGMRWRGLFIRANDGEEVRAIAAGEVVFSDWMRGYGNLIIVDHGDEYMTIYANNDALLRVVGERVEGGAPIANVGASGGVGDSGLYFEIRHKGEPIDPLRWIRRR